MDELTKLKQRRKRRQNALLVLDEIKDRITALRPGRFSFRRETRIKALSELLECVECIRNEFSTQAIHDQRERENLSPL